MFNGMIRGFKRELEWYKDDYDLLKDFFEQDDFCMIYDIQALHRFTKQNHTRTSDLLMGALGPLQSSIIIVKITEFSKDLLSTYTTTLDNVYRNQSLTLRHYWTAVKTACRPTTYPALNQYSWYCADTRSKNFTSTEHAFDRIHDDFMAGILALPMPSPLVRMLRLDESNCLEKVVHQQEQRLSEAVHVLFTMLNDPQKASFSRLYRDMEECLKQTAVLVKQAAHACYPTMSSWMTEVIEWGKQTDQIELVKSVVREVKLFYLVVDSTAHSVLGNQGGASLAPIRQRLTFREYLIEKAIQILESYCPVSHQLKENLRKDFHRFDDWRRRFLCFIYALNALFRPQAAESKPPLKEWVEILFPLTETFRPFARACELRKNYLSSRDIKPVDATSPLRSIPAANLIPPEESEWPSTQTAHVLNAFFWLFSLDYLTGFTIEASNKTLLLGGFYYLSNLRPSLPSGIISLYEELQEQRKVSTKNRVLSSQVVTVKDYIPLLTLFIWEIYFQVTLPSEVSKTLLDEIIKLPLLEQKKALLCVHRVLSLYQNRAEFDQKFEELLKGLSGSLEGNRQLNLELSGSKSFFERGLEILEKSGLQSGEKIYDCLHALLCFSDCHYYLDLGNSLQNVVFERIRSASQQNRKLCIQMIPSDKGGWSTAQAVHSLHTFFWLFTLDYLHGFAQEPSNRGFLLTRLNHLSQQNPLFPSQIVSSYESLHDPQKVFAKSAVLSSEWATGHFEHRLALFIWETYFHETLPPEASKTFLDEIVNLTEIQQKQALLCLHRVLSFYRNQTEFNRSIAALLKCLGFDLEANRKLNEQFSDPRSFFESSLQILEASGLKSEEKIYDCLHALFCLSDCQYYLSLESGLKDVLFKRIQATSQQDREHCIQELIDYSSIVVNKPNKEFKQLYMSYGQWSTEIQEAYKRKAQLIERAKEKQAGSPSNSTLIYLREVLAKGDSLPSAQFSLLVTFHFQVIEQVERLIEAPLPLITVLTLLFYCPFLPVKKYTQEAYVLEKLNAVLRLRDHLFNVRNSLFVSPSFVREVRHVLDVLSDPDICVGLPGFVRLDKHKEALKNEIQATLLPALSFRQEVCQQARQLFTTHVLGTKLQNVSFLPLLDHSNSEKNYLGQWNGPVYRYRWGIEKNKEGEFAYFEMVIWHTKRAGRFESRQIRCRLHIPLKELTENAWNMLDILFETVERDELADEKEERKIENLNNLEEEFTFNLQKFTEPLKKRWKSYLEKHEEDKQQALFADIRKDLPVLAENAKNLPPVISKASLESFKRLSLHLFGFVKEIKIEYRKAMLSFFTSSKNSSSQHLSLLQLAAQGNVYCNATGFSLICPSIADPCSKMVDAVFQVRHDELKEEFAQLTKQLAGCQEVQDSRDFCLISCHNKSQKTYQWKVSIEFDPLPIVEEGETVYLNQVTFKLDCPPSPLVYSCKWKGSISHPDFERFLRWQFMMLKSVYYRFLMTQSSKYPDSNGSRESSWDHPPVPVESTSLVSQN